jgi:hypothetical protein
MKKLVAMMLMSGFLSVSAQAQVGRNETPRVDCTKVIQSIQEQLKRGRSAGEAPAAPRPDDGAPNSRPAQ